MGSFSRIVAMAPLCQHAVSSSVLEKNKHTFPIKYSEKEAFDKWTITGSIDGMVALDMDSIKILKTKIIHNELSQLVMLKWNMLIT
ncbi:hypothetical protein M0813_13871 [Anaeramoeba flamelloides]|uniref:Uncharacterized protein n=1 Tax=Anaeramoeba flamelloides TaxID=1746091 RepID=A0ABQ8Z7L7_9EUKA|nr:hypothetical protein M0813_13871 [Anaeramoeba flamelloides]